MRIRLISVASVAALLIALLAARPTRAEAPAAGSRRIGLFDVHRTLGTIALGAFATALVVGAASGNLGKLTDPARCCPDGGYRLEPWRTVDRALVTSGIVAYVGAAGLATYNLLVRNPPSENDPRVGHAAHRWLALGHGAVFATSAITGIIMSRSQSSNPERFATAARIHVAANVVLVPLLTAAMSNILFE